MDNVQRSGLDCLKELLKQMHLNPDWDGVVTPDMVSLYDRDSITALLKIGDAMEYQPNKIKLDELKGYAGPALALLKNNHYVVVVNTVQLSGDKVGLFNPRGSNGPATVMLSKEQFLQIAEGTLITFSNLRDFDSRRHSSIYCLVSIANHHRISLNSRRVMHDYAIATDELSPRQLVRIGGDNSLKIARAKMPWRVFAGMGKAFPAIIVRKDGKHAIVCGYRETPEGGQLAVIDPNSPPPAQGERFLLWDKKTYLKMCSGYGFMIKRVYKMFDEERPFGLLWFIPEFLKLKGVFSHIAFAVLMINLVALVMPLFFQIIVDKVLVSQSYNTLQVLIVAICVILIFNGIMEYLRGYLLLFATNKIDISTATKTFAHLMRLPVDFFERVPSGVLLKHMQQTEKIRGFLSGNLFFTILDIFALCIFIPFLMIYSVRLTLIVLGFSLLMALVIASLIKPFQRRLDELYQAEGKRQSMLVESIHGVKTVKSLALEPVERKIWDDSTAYAIKSHFRVGKISMTAQSISHMLEMMMTVCVIWVGAHLVFSHTISIGELIAFQMLANRVTGPLVKMVGLIHEYQQIALSVRMLGVVMNTPPEPAGGGVRNPFRGQVEFEDISFRYRPDLPEVIKNFTLDIPAGTTVGFVGRSGSGKTTLTKLLQGLYPVTRGLIKIDGIDIREIDKAHLRRNIGVVLQENYFFSGSVRQNISLPKQNASLEEIIFAAKLAGADEFIQKLPRGYDTILEENASNLSGGQKQRLAIARALLTNPPILIFDEATSALDPESEEVIRKNLKNIAKGRTVIIVSHRLSIVSHADKIITLDEGVLSSAGTHEELLKTPGIYREFWNQQMRGE